MGETSRGSVYRIDELIDAYCDPIKYSAFVENILEVSPESIFLMINFSESKIVSRVGLS